MQTYVRPMLWFALAGLLAGCQSAGDGIDARAIRQYSIDEFLGSTSLRGASFSPDNSKILVSSDQTGVLNAYAIPLDGSEPVQLTESTTDAILVESYFPRDERVIYLADQGGNELDHVYVRELDGTIIDITPGEGHKADFLDWAYDGTSFFITTNERDSHYFDIYEVATDGYERARIYQNDSGFSVRAISANRRYIALRKDVTRTNTDVYLHDRETGETRNLTSHEGEVYNDPEVFNVNGLGLYFRSDEGSEFRYLARYDLSANVIRRVVSPNWDVQDARLSRNGKYMLVTINNDARTQLMLMHVGKQTEIQLAEIPAGQISSPRFAPDEETIAFYVSSGRSPRDLFVTSLEASAPRKVTSTLNANINPDDLVEAEVVRFASYDGVEIPGVLYRPHQASAKNKAPALVWVHGGPGGQSRVGYRGLIQYLVNHGYVVYAINNRGSSGYGKTFYTMDDRKHGDADLGDVVASKAMLIETGYVDPERIGIIGGSYGGYMVLAALAFRPEEFEVGVDIFGVANWVRTLESIPPWWEAQRQALFDELGDPSVDREYLTRISPLFHAENIVRPLIVLQGANDPRVLKVESDEIVEAVRANGVPVEYIVFEDEGHGFQKKENQLRGYRAILRFLDQYLKGESAEIAA